MAGIRIGSSNSNRAVVILGLAALMLLCPITLEGAIRRIASRLHMAGHAIFFPHAERAMHVNKSNQLELERASLAKRVRL